MTRAYFDVGETMGGSETHRFLQHPMAAEASAPLLAIAGRAEGVAEYLKRALPELLRVSAARYLSLMEAGRGQWRTMAACGQTSRPPDALLADALDAQSVQTAGPWAAAPLREEPSNTELLVMEAPSLDVQQLRSAARALSSLMGVTSQLVRQRCQTQRRAERLEAILRIAARWNQTRDMHQLLQQMAEAATGLFGAERASIFLWDRRTRTLVGRPALGVGGGELRIPDDRGIVGQVVSTAQPRRVDRDSQSEQREVFRDIDQQLGYETRTLLCVPLRCDGGDTLGAFELINKRAGNFTADDEQGLIELAKHAAIALENSQHYQQLLARRRQMTDEAAQQVQLIGTSHPVEELRATIQRVARTDLAVLVLGENGTGKEVASRLIHFLSPRRDEPFVAVNCAALTETLLESELFGHERGAFTDAVETRAGKFELANGGTLLLDEIGDLSPGGQAKLLRVLEEKVVVRVGGTVGIPTDTRVIAATNQDLAELVRQRRFRQDLFFRLNVVTLQLPPLRERGEDIMLLADHFLQEFSARARRRPLELSAAARKKLLQYPWPGNVRELRNLMERIAFLSPGERVEAEEIGFVLTPHDAPAAVPMDLPLNEATRQFQIEYIQKHIDSAQGNMTNAARRLGLHRSNLYRKMKQLDMPMVEPPDSETTTEIAGQ